MTKYKFYKNSPLNVENYYAVCIFSGITERPFWKSQDKFSFMFLYIFCDLLKLNPKESSQFWLFVALFTDKFYQRYQ